MHFLRMITTSIITFGLWCISITECTQQELPLSLHGSLHGKQERSVNTQGSQCSIQFKECIKSYFDYFNDFQENYTSGVTIQVDEANVDQMCNLGGSLGECLENTRELCQSDAYWGIQRVHYYTSLLEYLCSTEGRIAFLRTNGSQCGKQDTQNKMQSECERSTQKTFHLERQNNRQAAYCSYIEKYRQCSFTAIKECCGRHLAVFISQIDQTMNVERYTNEKTMYGC